MAAPVTFCTYFDSRYLSRGLVLYESLRRHAPWARLHALCMDDRAHEVLKRHSLPSVSPIRLADFEDGDTALLAAKRDRTRIEYFFTCTPSLPLYVLRKNPEIECVIYVDADCYFFSSPETIVEEMGAGSIYLVGHRYPESFHAAEEFGRYNVGILGFRNDREGLRCLQTWRSQCNAWCYDRRENGKFADQKYLDVWPEQFCGVVISRHPGVNLAPWNKANHTLHTEHGTPHVDGRPVVCYHFHGVRFYPFGIIEPQAIDYGAALSSTWLRLIYDPYLKLLAQTSRRLGPSCHDDLRSGHAPSLVDLLTGAGRAQCLVRVGNRLTEIPVARLEPLRIARKQVARWLRPLRRKMASNIGKGTPFATSAT